VAAFDALFSVDLKTPKATAGSHRILERQPSRCVTQQSVFTQGAPTTLELTLSGAACYAAQQAANPPN